MKLRALGYLGGLACCLFTTACSRKTASSEAAPSATASAIPSVAAPAKLRAVAIEHLPEGCQLVVRVDARKLFTNPILGKQLLVGLGDPSEAPPQATAGNEAQRAFLAMLKDLDLSPKRDVEEVVACVVKRGVESRFLLAIGGELPEGVPEAMRRNAPSQKDYEATDVGGRPAIGREGKWLTQSADRTILFGDDKELLKSALAKGNAHQGYAIPKDRDAALVASGGMFDAATKEPMLALLGRAKRMDLGIDLARGDIAANAQFASETDAKLVAAGLQNDLAGLRQQMRAAPPALASATAPWQRALDTLAITPAGDRLALGLQVEKGVIETTLQQLLMMSMLGGAPMGGALNGTLGGPVGVLPGPGLPSPGLSGPPGLAPRPGFGGAPLPTLAPPQKNSPGAPSAPKP